MSPELEMKLVSEFPSFFRDYHGNPTQTCMAWGCDIGDGWYTLLHDLCVKLKPLDTWDFGPYKGHELGASEWKFYFTQIKEKWGQLRIYSAGTTKEMYDLIEQAEKESYKTCEQCGSKENVTIAARPTWILTLCKKCDPKDWEPIDMTPEVE
jgi:hypothetical protein